MIAVDSGASPQACQVPSHGGLGEALTPDDVALQDPRKVVLLLGLGAIRHDGGTRMVQRHEAQVMVGSIRASVFLVPDELPGERKPKATVFFRPGDAGPARVI